MYGVDYQAKASSEIGYQISADKGKNWNYYCGEMLNTSDGLYVIKSPTDARGYWISSPSAGGKTGLEYVYNNGGVSGYYYLGNFIRISSDSLSKL